MTVWADGDSLQAELRDLLCRRAASQSEMRFSVVFVSARRLRVPADRGITTIQVDEGPDAADNQIVESCKAGDLAVTRDIPLAERLAEKGIAVLNDRGDVFTSENVHERRSLRDRAAELRADGLAPELDRHRSWGKRELKYFADALDRELTKALKKSGAA